MLPPVTPPPRAPLFGTELAVVDGEPPVDTADGVGGEAATREVATKEVGVVTPVCLGREDAPVETATVATLCRSWVAFPVVVVPVCPAGATTVVEAAAKATVCVISIASRLVGTASSEGKHNPS